MKELLRTGNLAHAHSLVAALEAEGIATHLQGEHGASYIEGGVSVFVVGEHDWEAAQAVLAILEGPSD
jgi:hypothetical protein